MKSRLLALLIVILNVGCSSGMRLGSEDMTMSDTANSDLVETNAAEFCRAEIRSAGQFAFARSTNTLTSFAECRIYAERTAAEYCNEVRVDKTVQEELYVILTFGGQGNTSLYFCQPTPVVKRSFNITVVARDLETGAGIAGATIILSGANYTRTLTADGNGFVNFGLVTESTYGVDVFA